MNGIWNVNFFVVLSLFNSGVAVLNNCQHSPGNINAHQFSVHDANNKDLEVLNGCLENADLIFTISIQTSSISITALVSSLPERVKQTVSELIISTSDVRIVPSGSLANFTNVHTINFSNNTISDLEENSFQHMTKVTSINLSYNNLTTIASRTFYNMPSLIVLSLEGNELVSIPSDAFLNVPKLDVLYMDRNNFKVVPYNAFRNFPIKYWHLAYNKIFKITSQIEQFPHLLSLDIRHNNLKTITWKLSTLHNLKELHISDNQLKSLPEEISSLLKNNRSCHITLGNNPWHCGCDLRWLISFNQQGAFSDDLNCTTPQTISMIDFNLNNIVCLQDKENGGIIWNKVITIILPAILFLFCSIAGVSLYFSKNRTKGLKKPIQMILNGQYYRPMSYADTAEVCISTNTFSNGLLSPNDFDHKQYGTLRLGKLIGRGAFSDVFEGFSSDVDNVWKKVAVKKIRDNARTGDTETFAAEYQTLMNIGKHQNIIQIYGTGEIDGSVILVLEYSDNGDLLAHLKEIDHTNSKVIQNLDSSEWKMYLQNTHPRLFLYMWHIAKGMEYLSRLKIVHRDLAGRNILLSSKYVAKISDFGLSRDIYEDGYYYQNSNGRMPYKWMSPESLSNGRYTSKSDVWSFGILLWEIVTLGAGPYPGIPPDMLQNMYKHNYIMPQPPLCPDYIYSVMEQCWNYSPDDRPEFDNLLETFDELLQTVTQKDYIEVRKTDEED